MKAEKKEFQKAEVEVIRFEKTDIITTSQPGGGFPDPVNDVWGD